MPSIGGDPAAGRQLSSITLDDAAGAPVVLHATSARRVYGAAGLIGVSPPRQVVRPRPSAHGFINDTRNTEGRLIVLDGRVYSPLSYADASSEFRAIAGAALETLDEGAALLKWTEDGGLALQALVKLHGELEPAVAVGPNLLAYQAQFLAADPRAYSQAQSTSIGTALVPAPGGKTLPRTLPKTFSTSTGGTVAVNNLGNRPTPPILRVYGGVTNPLIQLAGTAGQIALQGTIGNGDYIELDAAERTLKLNGTSPARGFLDPANTRWFELPKGTSTIQIVAGTFDASARVDVLYRSAYT